MQLGVCWLLQVVVSHSKSLIHGHSLFITNRMS